jgi:hypothetical protein
MKRLLAITLTLASLSSFAGDCDLTVQSSKIGTFSDETIDEIILVLEDKEYTNIDFKASHEKSPTDLLLGVDIEGFFFSEAKSVAVLTTNSRASSINKWNIIKRVEKRTFGRNEERMIIKSIKKIPGCHSLDLMI